jgi:hypothetical protein
MHFKEQIHTQQMRQKIAYSEYLITWLKLLDVSAIRFNPPRYVISEYLVFWF